MRARAILVACGLVAVTATGYVLLAPNGWSRLTHQREEVDALRDDVAKLERENERLAGEATLLRGGTPASDAHLEKLAREELGHVRPEEKLLLMKADAAASEGGAP
jgi:cell division protein FtsB